MVPCAAAWLARAAVCLQSRGLGPQWFASGRRDRLGTHSGEDGPAVRDRLRAAA